MPSRVFFVSTGSATRKPRPVGGELHKDVDNPGLMDVFRTILKTS